MKVLVTGASGMLGRALVARLVRDGLHAVLAARRRVDDTLPVSVETVQIGDLALRMDWRDALSAVDVVVHAAARVHVLRDGAGNPLDAYRRVNTQATLDLARQSAAGGVRRFVFLSSIKVNGETTEPGRPFTAEGPLQPQDAYAISKAEAEQGLRQLAGETGMECVIVRPPLVYGPGVKANFAALMSVLDRGLLLPLAAIHNRRSLMGLDNLVDLLATCIEHPAAAHQTFLASDGMDLATPDLLRRLGEALGRPARLFAVPEWMLRSGAALIGRPGVAERLCGSLQADITATCQRLDWKPPVGVDEGLKRTVMAWREARERA